MQVLGGIEDAADRLSHYAIIVAVQPRFPAKYVAHIMSSRGEFAHMVDHYNVKRVV